MEGEIMDIMAYMFDEENNKRLFGLEQWRLGEEKGREEGRNEGRVEGREEGQKLTAINLLNMNMDISFIEKATGLSKEEILKLKK
jgi:predicted transposase/invertase (TIGR01784 family)